MQFRGPLRPYDATKGLTDTIYHLRPRPGGKICTPRIIKFTKRSSRCTSPYIYLFLNTGSFREEDGLKIGHISPLSQRSIIPNLKIIGAVVIKKKLKMFKYSQTQYVMFGPALWRDLYPKDNEVHNFGRSLPVVHHH
jgi:hypothetical protein